MHIPFENNNIRTLGLRKRNNKDLVSSLSRFIGTISANNVNYKRVTLKTTL